MSDFVLMADSTSDLAPKFQEEYDIEIVYGHMTLPDGKEISQFLKWEKFTREEFYDALRKNPAGYTTAPANVNEFYAAFEKHVKEGKKVLLMTISTGISGTYGFATKAKEEILRNYPDADIRVIDSLRFGPGYGLMAIYASIYRSEGHSIDETEKYIEENKNRFHQAGWMDDLSFVAKKGRITHAKAFFGTLVGIKTIGEFDYNGLTTVIGKVKGAKSTYEALMNYIENTIENPEDQIIFIAHTNRAAAAEEYKKMIEEKFKPKAIFINDVFPGCGINIGPGLMAAYYVGKPITEGLVDEKKIIDEFLAKAK